MIQDGVKSIARRQPQKAPLSGYHFYMDRLRVIFISYAHVGLTRGSSLRCPY
jgi:hypothetical protein